MNIFQEEELKIEKDIGDYCISEIVEESSEFVIKEESLISINEILSDPEDISFCDAQDIKNLAANTQKKNICYRWCCQSQNLSPALENADMIFGKFINLELLGLKQKKVREYAKNEINLLLNDTSPVTYLLVEENNTPDSSNMDDPMFSFGKSIANKLGKIKDQYTKQLIKRNICSLIKKLTINIKYI